LFLTQLNFLKPQAMTERLWGIVLGLLIGANLGGHILRLTLLGFSPITPRHYIPIFALGLYFVAAVLVFLKRKGRIMDCAAGSIGWPYHYKYSSQLASRTLSSGHGRY
jgi:hypothetical protein